MPLTTNMQFKIASQTKAFTADLILQLVGEGKVSFDDHISKWVVGVPNGDQITIRKLLNMTSGLSTGFLSVEANQKAGHWVHRSGHSGGRRVAAPGRAARHQMVLQQLRLRPARAGGGGDDGPGREHGHPAAHRRTPRPTPHPPPLGTA